MNEWVEWTGGECPVAHDQLVFVKLRSGFTSQEQKAGTFSWECMDDDADIIAYRLVEQPDTIKQTSDGSTASYYELPEGAKELQDLIGYRDMNAQLGEIFRACYRYGKVAHSPKIRDIKKIIFYAQAELARLEKYGEE